MDTGDKIRVLRIDKGMTQAQLARAVGVDRTSISKYEAGSVENLKRHITMRLSEVLECSPGYLMGFEEVIR